MLTFFQVPIGGNFEGLGPLGQQSWNTGNTASMLTKLLSTAIGFLTVAAGLWFLIQFFIGAFSWLTAGSDKTSLDNARKKLTNAVIGLVLVVATVFIIDLLGTVLGLDILNPVSFLNSLNQ